MTDFVPCLGICVFFPDLFSLCFCIPAFASVCSLILQSGVDATAASQLANSKNGCNYFCRELHLPLLLVLRRLLLLVLLLLRRYSSRRKSLPIFFPMLTQDLQVEWGCGDDPP